VPVILVASTRSFDISRRRLVDVSLAMVVEIPIWLSQLFLRL